MGKIYKFLRDNKIEDINNLIEYKLGKRVYDNPDNIDIDIRNNHRNSTTYIILKEGDNVLELSSNNSLNTFLMNNMPIEDIGKLLLIAYIEDNAIYSISDFMACVYEDNCVYAYGVSTIKEDLYIHLEFSKELQIRKVYLKYEDERKGIIEINLDDLHEVLSSLEE